MEYSKRVQDTVRTVSDFVNCSSDFNEFAELMSREHRTLQQNFTKVCVAWLKQLANTEYYDLRNEASVEFAKSIKQQLDNACLPLI